jgi:hypothetical protein
MPETPVLGDRRPAGTARNAESQALEFKAKIDAIWR